MTGWARRCLRVACLWWLVQASALHAQAPEWDLLDGLQTLSYQNSARALKGLQAAGPRLKASPDPALRRTYLVTLIGVAMDTGQPSLVADAIEALEAQARSGDPVAQVLTAGARAHRLASEGRSLEARDLLLRQTPDSLKVADPLALWSYHLTLGTIQSTTGQFEAAVTNLLRSLDVARTLPRQSEASVLRSQVHLGMVYMEMKNQEKALQAIEEAMALARRLDATQSLGWLQLHRGNLVAGMGQLDLALEAYQQAWQLGTTAGMAPLVASAVNNMGDIHLRRKEYAQAEPLMRKAMAAYQEAGQPSGAALSRANLGFALMGQGQLEAGVPEVQAGIAFMRAAGARATEEDLLGELSRMYEQAGRYREAVETTRQQQALAKELFQIERQKAVGALQEQFDTAQRQRQIEQLAQENRIKDAELQSRRTQQIVLATGAAVLLLGGGVVLALYRRTRQANAGLRVARQDAEHALREKNMFLATASHDLRQPLHAMSLMVEALDLRNANPGLAPLVADLKQSMAALGQQFNALLDLSRLETGALQTSAVPVALPGLLRELVRLFREQASVAGLDLRLHLPPETASVRADPVLLRQTLVNLMHNALRYTRTGGLLVAVRRRGSEWQIEVWDTGIGIAAEEEEQVFSPYFRSEQAWQMDGAGHGLGLAVVARCTRLMGATSGFRSQPGKGSRFWLRLPACDPGVVGPAATVSTATPFPPLNGRCLVLDDDRQVLSAWQVLLESWGVTVQLADSTAVAHAALDAGFAPQVVFCDQRLRGGDSGFAVLKSLLARSPGASGAMVSGEFQSPALAQAEDEGYLVLHKPLDPVALHALLERCFAEAEQQAR